MQLLEENDRWKHGDGQHQHDPLKIVALEPTCKVQNQNYDCDCVKGIKHDVILPERTLLRPDHCWEPMIQQFVQENSRIITAYARNPQLPSQTSKAPDSGGDRAASPALTGPVPAPIRL